jgi:4-amino-4-deoxy-L-arabinose transferase-like glycosyltransferase
MVLLPVLCGFFLVLLLVRKIPEWRAALLLAAVAWGCLATAFTELLSLFSLLTYGGIAFCWAAATMIAGLLTVKLREHPPIPRPQDVQASEALAIGGIALICLVTFVIAIVAPPNNWDSMTYHMSRVAHWLQNRSVAHYPTHILRQLELGPWAEFAIAHFQALSGGDRYANLVQWASMVGSLLGASLIAMQLGGDRRTQIFAAVLVATIPMGILQSTSTQNDYVVAFWLTCMTWAGLRFIQDRRPAWAVVVGASLGLAILTKGTAYLYAFPFLVWIALELARRPWRRAAIAVLCIVIPSILLNASHYWRNFELFSSPLGSKSSQYTNAHVGAAVLASNMLRNLALQLASASGSTNHLIETGVANLHSRLGMDVNDPATTWSGTRFSVITKKHEDMSSNVLHTLLAGASLLTLAFVGPFRKVPRSLLCYLAAVAAGYVLFCLILKWQPWHSRLLLPLFVIGAPAVSAISARYWKPGIVRMIALTLLIASIPWVLGNVTRPLVNVSKDGTFSSPLLTYERDRLYFMNREDLYEKYLKIADDIRRLKATNIGLTISRGDFEYPLWVLIKERNPLPIRIEHVEVKNPSRRTRVDDFRPDFIVGLE